MPLLDDLILGSPGGDRRGRYGDGKSHEWDKSMDPGRGVTGALLSTLQTQHRPSTESPRGELAEDPAHGLGESERRSCGNQACGRSWTLPWKSRERPVFDGQWACSRACLSAMVRQALTRETGDGVYEDGPKPHHHRVPLGLVMLAQGWITHPQLQRALEAQRTHGSGRIGEWLVSVCGLQPERIARGLSAQWNCPVLSIDGSWPEVMALALPRVFLEEYGVVPLRVAGKKILYVGFQDSLDAAATFALERMTGLRAESGVLPEEEFLRARETLLRCEFPRQSMATAGDRDGLARAIAETVEHEQPEASRLVRLHRYFWLRVWAKGDRHRDTTGDGVCVTGDLPSNANGVKDYLFTIGGRVAFPVQNERVGRGGAGSGRRIALEEPVEVAAVAVGTDEPEPATERELAGGTALPERGKQEEHVSAVEAAASVNSEDSVGVDGLDTAESVVKAEAPAGAEVQFKGEPAAGAEGCAEAEDAVRGSELVSTGDGASIREGAWERHSLARREAWLDCYADGDDTNVWEGTEVREERTGLQRFMRRGYESEIETIDGEYLPVEATDIDSTALVPGILPSKWNRLGLLKRLRPSFPDREAGPGSGPGRGV